MFCNRYFPLLLTLGLMLAVKPPVAQGETPQEETGRLVGVLQADSPIYDKAMACRRLGVIGDGQAVPALAALLSDAKLATYARTALESIPGDEADAALRESIGKLKGSLLIGVIDSIGKGNDAKALVPLSTLADAEDATVAAAAVRAIGGIGLPESATILLKALAKASAERRPAVAKACLVCVIKLMNAGKADEAISLCDAVRQADVPEYLQLAATRQAIVARGNKGLEMLAAELKAEEETRFRFALEAARDLGTPAAPALAKFFPEASAARQELLVIALGEIGDSAVTPIFVSAAKSNAKDVRVQAIRILGEKNVAGEKALLLKAAVESDAEISAVAQQALAALEDDGVDAAILELLQSKNPAELRVAVQVAGMRHIQAASGRLLKLAGSADQEIRDAAVAALGMTVGIDDYPQLVDLAVSSFGTDRQEATSQALMAAGYRLPREQTATALAASMKGASVEVQVALLEQLTFVGGAKALDVVVTAARSSEDALQDASTRLLGTWMTADVAPKVIELSKSLKNQKYRIRALRAAARVVRQFDMPESERVETCRQIVEVAERKDEKLLAIDSLRRHASVEGLDYSVSLLEDRELRWRACLTIVAMGDKLAGIAPYETEWALVESLKVTTDAKQMAQTEELLARVRGLIAERESQAKFVPLFDGKTFTGWKGNLDIFRIENGEVVAGSLTEKVERNEFLRTTRNYDNFELRLQFKLLGEKTNGGVQIRTQEIPNHHEVSGYQADLGDGWWGCLYDESRRKKVLDGPPQEKRDEPVRRGEWNDYRVLCTGKRIQIWVNGVQTVDYTEPDTSIPQSGIIALQVHGNQVQEVHYRNITIREL